jgi:ATP-dependent helicase/nuclease subunit A
VANLRKLIDMARQFDQSGIATLADFTRRIQEFVSEQTVEDLAATHPESSDVVRLMTIHQAKGLEFPVVIVADMERKNRGSSWDAVYHPEFGPLLAPPKFGTDEPSHPALRMHKYVEDREDEDESRRILYVALTRAADHLILSAGLGADPGLRADHGVKSQWMKLLAERYDLGTGLEKFDPYFASILSDRAGSRAKTVSGKQASRGAAPDESQTVHVHRQPPELTVVPRSDTKAAKLEQLRELVETAEPCPLPPLMRAIVPIPAQPLQLTVSQIEEADARLQGTKVPRRHHETASGDPEEAEAPRGEAATLLGSLVHRVIERLPRDANITSDMLAAGVQAVLKSQAGGNAATIDSAAMVRRVQALVESEPWSEIRSAKQCFREIEFLLGWPDGASPPERTAVIAGTLDCLLLSTGGAWKILDYKTGRLPAGDPAALLKHFSIQLVLYAEAVRAMVGRPPEAIEIVALHDKVDRFPLIVWDEFLGPVKERIDAAIGRLAANPDLRSVPSGLFAAAAASSE